MTRADIKVIPLETARMQFEQTVDSLRGGKTGTRALALSPNTHDVFHSILFQDPQGLDWVIGRMKEAGILPLMKKKRLHGNPYYAVLNHIQGGGSISDPELKPHHTWLVGNLGHLEQFFKYKKEPLPLGIGFSQSVKRRIATPMDLTGYPMLIEHLQDMADRGNPVYVAKLLAMKGVGEEVRRLAQDREISVSDHGLIAKRLRSLVAAANIKGLKVRFGDETDPVEEASEAIYEHFRRLPKRQFPKVINLEYLEGVEALQEHLAILKREFSPDALRSWISITESFYHGTEITRFETAAKKSRKFKPPEDPGE